MPNDSIAVLDFETTGMSPAQQARATEVGVVIVEDGRIVARYQSLMNSGAWVPPFIEQLTGISNAMLRSAPPAAQVMREVADFVGERPLLAHNASFDQKFWDAELALIGRRRAQPFACSLLLARRLLPQAPSAACRRCLRRKWPRRCSGYAGFSRIPRIVGWTCRRLVHHPDASGGQGCAVSSLPARAS